MKLGVVNPLTGTDFNFDNIESLWYHNVDYGLYLRQQLLPPINLKWNEEFMYEHGALQLFKSLVVQIVQSIYSILSIIPTLAYIMCEHSNFNLKEMEK